MIYAPILIPTLCRHEHFIRCVESLKKNTWAKYTDVYIALDYPAKESHWEGYSKISEYLEGDFSEFANFYVIKREHNYGSGRNMRELREQVFEKYDAFIRTDDDCEFSPNFIEYMDRCLVLSKNDDRIIGVTGYSYPLDWKIAENANVFSNSLVFPMWGTGFWKKKYKHLEAEIQSGCVFKYLESGNRIPEMTQARFVDFVHAVLDFSDQSWMWRVTDVTLGVYMQLFDKQIISPRLSLVRNHGFDGSGEYCAEIKVRRGITALDYNYFGQVIDIDTSFVPVIDKNASYAVNKTILDTFDSRPLKAMLKAKLKLQFYRIVGKKNYKKLWDIKHK